MLEKDLNDPTFLPTEGNRGFSALCQLCRHLGFKDPFNQLMNNDGISCVGDLMCFLEDNPGAIGALYDWINDNYRAELEEEDEDDGD